MKLPDSPCTPSELAEALVDALAPGSNLVIPIANGEPIALLDALEARAERLSDVKIHQMHALRDRPYLNGAYRGHLEHVSWFLSHVTRPAFWAGGCHFAPGNFSEVPQFLLDKQPAAVLAAASPPDAHGYFSLGVSADYAAALIGRVPFVLEVNPRMPRTHGTNRLHVSDVAAWCSAENELVELQEPTNIRDEDRVIAELVTDRIPHQATIQLGFGGVPTQVARLLSDHRDLGVHTELLSNPIVNLVEAGVVTGVYKKFNRGRIVTTFALGNRKLYDFCDGNDVVQFLAVDESTILEPSDGSPTSSRSTRLWRSTCSVSVHPSRSVRPTGRAVAVRPTSPEEPNTPRAATGLLCSARPPMVARPVGLPRPSKPVRL